MRTLLLILICGSSHADSIRVGLNDLVTLKVKGLRRIAVARTGVVKAVASPPNEVVLFGKKVGSTSITIWTESGSVSHQIQVVPYAAGDPATSHGRLIRVALEFIEFDRRRFEELGIRWPSQETFSLSKVASATAGLNVAVPFFSAPGFIHHLAQQGDAKLIASPELFVREGEEATFHSGGEFPVSTSSENYGRYHRHVEWKPYGVQLRVKPQSFDGWHISSDIKVEVSELSSGLAIDGVPSVSRRRIDTKVDSLDRETLILSGLKRTRESHGVESIPIIQDLPIVGPLFKSRRSEAESTELLVAMTLSFAGEKEGERLEQWQKRWEEPGDVR